MKTTGEKIRDLRIGLGLKQSELAEKAGITIRSITNYETDAVKPRSLQLRKLCEILHVTEDYLLNPEIDDPSYGLDTAPDVETVRTQFGKKGATDLKALLEANQMMLAGGDIPQEDKDLFFEAVMKAYIQTKQEARETFTPKKYKK